MLKLILSKNVYNNNVIYRCINVKDFSGIILELGRV